MSGYNELKNAIRRVVKTNNNREITGQNLQSTLTSMVNSLGANYHFAGFASPDTNPGTPDQNIFYIASEEGTYVNFDGINLEPGLSFLMWNGKWSSETISVGEVTKSWVQQNYVSIAFFNELFELYNDSTKIAVNDTIPVDKTKLNIKAMFGFWTEQYISALGKNDSRGSGSGVDMATVWSALAGSTDEQINKSHLTTALSEYATQSWVSQIFATIASIPTKLSQLANDTGFITSAALPTKLSQLANDTGFITSTALPTKLSQLANDTGFITSAALPTKVSQLVNDAGYVTSSIVNGYAKQSWVSQNYALKSDIPTKLSQLANDTGFITSDALPTKVSQLVNDAGYVTASIVNGYATQSWVSQNYVSVEFFERLFQAYSGTTKVDTNSTSAIDNIKAMFGFWTEQYISALGQNDSGGSGGGGLMGSIVPYAKAISLTTQNEGEEIASAWSVKMLYDKIENVDVSGQLTSYLTKQEAQALYQPVGNYLTGITKEQVEGVLTGNITSHTHSQYLTSHQDISGKADRSELSQYLPLSGGTMSGTLIISAGSASDWTEGIRINDAYNGWASLVMGGTSTNGTGSNIWSLHTYQSNFYLANNGSYSFNNGIQCVSGAWTIKGTSLKFGDNTIYHTGNLTNVSQLTNDAGFITSSALPTKVSQLVNDAGYITSSGSCNYATSAGYVDVRSTNDYGSEWYTVKSDTNPLRMLAYDVYNNGGPETFGNVLEITGITRHWEPQLWFGAWESGHIAYRNKNFKSSSFGSWKWLIDTENWTSYIGTSSAYVGYASYATSAGVANSVAWSNVSGRPTSMPASDVYAWAKAATKPNYTYDEINLKTSVNAADYTRVVIALCEVTELYANTGAFSSGEILYYRFNGANPIEYAKVNFIDSYGLNYDAFYSLESSFENESKDKPITNLNTHSGFRKCTFVYNGKHYAGVEAYFVQAASYYWRGYSNGHNVFGVIVEERGTVKNEEIYNSLSYDGQNRSGISFGDVRADSFAKKDSSDSYVLLGGGGHSLISSLSVATAAKLQTARTIWGQSFDGTSNVDGNLSCNGQGSFNSLQIGNITIIYDAANKGLRIAGGGLYTDSYLSSLGVYASTALSVKKWADSINLTEESDAELATAYSIGNLYRLINSNQKTITESLNQSVSALQGRCTSLEQRVSALENKVN